MIAAFALLAGQYIIQLECVWHTTTLLFDTLNLGHRYATNRPLGAYLAAE